MPVAPGAGWDSSRSGQIRRSAWELLRVVNGTPQRVLQGSACSTTGSTGDLAGPAGSYRRHHWILRLVLIFSASAKISSTTRQMPRGAGALCTCGVGLRAAGVS
jgi:hypothetical protein